MKKIFHICAVHYDKHLKCRWYMRGTEFLILFILVNLDLNLNNHMWLVATILDHAA